MHDYFSLCSCATSCYNTCVVCNQSAGPGSHIGALALPPWVIDDVSWVPSPDQTTENRHPRLVNTPSQEQAVCPVSLILRFFYAFLIETIMAPTRMFINVYYFSMYNAHFIYEFIISQYVLRSTQILVSIALPDLLVSFFISKAAPDFFWYFCLFILSKLKNLNL